MIDDQGGFAFSRTYLVAIRASLLLAGLVQYWVKKRQHWLEYGKPHSYAMGKNYLA
jgi:hypothetical protein